MFTSDVIDAEQKVMDAMAALDALVDKAEGDARIRALMFHEQLRRKLKYEDLRLIARIHRDYDFHARDLSTASGIADILSCTLGRARRLVKVAESVFPTTLDGRSLAPRMPATAAALGAFTIDGAHADVIEHALSSPAARRLEPGRWEGAEVQLAKLATEYRPDELAVLAREMIEKLDQDGPRPDDGPAQVNELHLTQSRDGSGGRIKGQLDAQTFSALRLALEGHRVDDAEKTLAERDADALGELCANALNQGELPDQGGQRPHLTLTLPYEQLRRGLASATLDDGTRLVPSAVRLLACDCGVTPVVMNGVGMPLDIGREKRTASTFIRRAVAARDQGCAFPGCRRKPGHCEVHHVTHWADGGETKITNLVMLCWHHHRKIHHTDWKVRMLDGIPEFIPPRWVDFEQRPRRKPHYPFAA